MYHNNKQVGRTRVNKIKEGKLSRKTHVQNKKPKNKPFTPTYYDLVAKRKQLDMPIKHEAWRTYI